MMIWITLVHQAEYQRKFLVPTSESTFSLTGLYLSGPVSLPSGPNCITLLNRGTGLHELALFRLESGQIAQDLLASLSPGKPAVSLPARPLFSLSGLPGEGTPRICLALEPGSYALLCLVKTPEAHQAQAGLGVVKKFEVLPASLG